MKPELFYCQQANAPLRLTLFSKDAYQQKHRSLQDSEQIALKVQDFLGEIGQLGFIYNASGEIENIYVGLGEGTDAQALASIIHQLPANAYYQMTSPISAQAYLIWSLAQYRFERYKESTVKPRILQVPQQQLASVLNKANAVFFVRDLINTPTSDMGPSELANSMHELAQQHAATFKQWIGDELLTENFPAIHAVGRASISEPRLLSMTWGNPAHPRITLIGKGVCFDSGGLDIKPSSGMRLMKKDMGGAAQVLGLAGWLMAEQLPIYLHVLIPAVENAIGPDAYRPGDVLIMRNGLSVEIENTDAEGRLVLADAIAMACEEKPELIIDFATLTGAARIAVGTEISALFCNDDELASAFVNLSQETSDPVWRMPLHASYKSLLDSSIADMANAGTSSYAGAITAALFLERFVVENISWAHFDIMAWNMSNKPGKPEGGEAMGILTVGEYLLKRYGKSS